MQLLFSALHSSHSHSTRCHYNYKDTPPLLRTQPSSGYLARHALAYAFLTHCSIVRVCLHPHSLPVIILPPPSPWRAPHILIIPCPCEADELTQGADRTFERGGPSCLLICYCPVVPHINQDGHPLNTLRPLFCSFQ